MLYDSLRQRATPKATSTCPCCRTALIAKCGSVKIHHWAHESLIDCDEWYEGISDWHLSYQGYVKEDCREVVVGDHRADIKLSSGKVIELQHSPITPEVVAERELHYGHMIWIFDAEKWKKNFMMKSSSPDRMYFRWKRAHKGVLACEKPIFFDLGNDEILQVTGKKTYENESNKWDQDFYYTHYLWGKLWDKATFLFDCFEENIIGKTASDLLPDALRD